MRSVKFLTLVLATTAMAWTSSSFAAGNSGSSGKPYSTTFDSASMDDHTDSQLNRTHKKNKKLGPRTSQNTSLEDQLNPLGEKGSGGSSNFNDTATGISQ